MSGPCILLHCVPGSTYHTQTPNTQTQCNELHFFIKPMDVCCVCVSYLHATLCIEIICKLLTMLLSLRTQKSLRCFFVVGFVLLLESKWNAWNYRCFIYIFFCCSNVSVSSRPHFLHTHDSQRESPDSVDISARKLWVNMVSMVRFWYAIVE